MPPLNLTGVSAENNMTITLNKEVIQDTALAWAHFHNGVAAGLRITNKHNTKLSTTWIAHHRSVRKEERTYGL